MGICVSISVCEFAVLACASHSPCGGGGDGDVRGSERASYIPV